MTSEQKYFIDVTDIVNVVLECSKCRASVSVPASRWTKYPSACPHCTEQWNYIGDESKDITLKLAALLSVLQERHAQPSFPYRLRFEVTPPKA